MVLSHCTLYNCNKHKCRVSSSQTGDDKVMLRTKNYSKELSNSRANNSTCFGLITTIIQLIRDLKVIYILNNFGTNWLIFLDENEI